MSKPASRWIDVAYKCKCMATEATVSVQERRPAEDVLDFMARVREAIWLNHLDRSPACAAKTMEYAKLPIGDDGVGHAEGGTA